MTARVPAQPRFQHLRLALATGAAMLAGGYLAGHATYTKPLFNLSPSPGFAAPRWTSAMVNGTTRGSATVQQTTLYMMDPPLNHTGMLTAQGWRIVVQDEDASTLDGRFTMHYVKYASNGVDPDPSGVLHSFMFWFFFGGATGQQAMEFIIITLARQLREPNHGIAVELRAAPSWPNDGISVHGQFNLPNDPLRPRVPAPYNQQVWAFDAPPSSSTPVPLGGRVLDTLLFATVWTVDPVLQTYVQSAAYGTTMDLFGPESMHPDANRGDKLGFFVQSTNNGLNGNAYVFAAPRLSPTPLRLSSASGSNPFVLLDVAPPFPVCLSAGPINPANGQLKLPAIDFNLFPPCCRNFWFQALLHFQSPFPSFPDPVELTDATGVRGL